MCQPPRHATMSPCIRLPDQRSSQEAASQTLWKMSISCGTKCYLGHLETEMFESTELHKIKNN